MVLSRGLNFCIPPPKICKEQIFSEFEIMYSQLSKHAPSAVEGRVLELSNEYALLTAEQDFLAFIFKP